MTTPAGRGTPRPKRFVATRDFTYGLEHYRTGDEVPSGATLARLIALGGFVESTGGKPAPTNTTSEPVPPTHEGADHG